MKIYKSWLVISIAAVILFVTTLLFSFSLSGKSDLLETSKFTTGSQNFSLAHDSVKKIIFVGTYKNSLVAFDNSGKKLWDFSTKGPVREMKVDEKKRKLYVGSEDRNIYILDIETGTQTSIIKVQRRIYSIDINEDASLIAVSAGINTLKHSLLLYDKDGNEIFQKDIGATSKKVAFNNDYSKIYLGTDRAEIMVFDLKGNELGKTKLNYEIVDMRVDKATSQVVVLTKNNTYYLLDNKLNTITKSTFYGEGVSVAASKDLKWIGIGNKEGDFYIADKSGKLVYSKRVDKSVTSILFEDDRVLVTGLGNFAYSLERSKLDTSLLIKKIEMALDILSIILPILIFVFIILSFSYLRNKTKRFAKILVKHRTAYLLLVPTFVLLIIFCYYPVFIALTRSFTDWSIHKSSMKEINFIWFDNFKNMIHDDYFISGLKNMAILIGTGLIKAITVPLLVAELVFLMRSDRQKYWFRFLFVLPMVVPGIVSALMWQNMYDPTIGLINTVLRGIGLENLQRVWLGDPATAIWAIVFMGFPFINAFAFLVYYGGLIDIPSSLFEAAKVDGSNGWWNFTRIHIPLISGQLKMLIILTFIGAIQDFGGILVLTSGGPGASTYVPGLEMYFNATRFGQYGYACALGFVMFIAIFIGTLFNMRMKAVSDLND